LDQGPGEKGKTEKQAPLSRRKMTFCFSCHYGSSTLTPRNGVWTGGRDPSIYRRWHLAFHLEAGALRLPVVTLAEGRVPVGGRAVSRAVPPYAFSAGVPILSTMVASSGYRPQMGGALSESSNEAMVSLIFFSPVRRSWTYRHSYKYRHG
jgi:hypothetical protein